jgi:hypothetical protein
MAQRRADVAGRATPLPQPADDDLLLDEECDVIAMVD